MRYPAVTLADARQWFFNVGPSATSEEKKLALNMLLKSVRDLSKSRDEDDIENMVMTLHAHCIISSVADLNTFLKTMKDKLGTVGLKLLINHMVNVPLCTGTTVGLNAMICAGGWNADEGKVRLLYAYGGRVDMVDGNGAYPDEAIPIIPYFNHLEMLHGGRHESGRSTMALARRIVNDYAGPVKEIQMIAGEVVPQSGWHPPPVVG